MFDAGTKGLIAWVAHLIGESGFEGDADALAPSILSAMAGAVAVSRAVSDKSLSDDMLDTARTGIKARLGVADADLARSKLQ